MPLIGTAFVIMWHDIAPENEQEYHLWHTRQHMPERLNHPGFRRSRRGVNWGATHQRYFTLYEGDALETFTSPEYAASLNNPTGWTTRVAPTFRNFLRTACSVSRTAGQGIGGALTTFRLSLPQGADEESALGSLDPILADFAANDAVTGVHVGAARRDYSDQRTRETELRPPMHERPFDLVVIVEGIGLLELERAAPAMTQALAARGFEPLPQCYDMAYVLDNAAGLPTWPRT